MSAPCFLCGGAGSAFVCSKNGFDIVRCTTCGLVRVEPLPSTAQIDEYYRDGYNQFKYSFSTPGADPSPVKSKELRLLERFGAHGRLLDIGSAYGHFLANASMNAWNVEGVEPQVEPRALSRSRFHLVVHESLAEAPEHSFQAATLWHVIEHIRTPKDFLLQVGEKLTDGGTLAIATPNIDSLVARATGTSWGWLSPPDHLFLYSPTTLPRLLEISGFELLHLETRRGQSRNTLLLMLQALVNKLGLFERVKGSVGEAASDFRTSQSFTRRFNAFWIAERVTEFLSLLLYPLLLLVWKMGLGDEVLAIARKKGAGDLQQHSASKENDLPPQTQA